jgi:hypothetical protein
MSGPGRDPKVADEDILNLFQETSDPVLTTSEVAEKLDIGHRGTFDRLERLADDDELKMKKVGHSGVVWWDPKSMRKNSE